MEGPRECPASAHDGREKAKRAGKKRRGEDDVVRLPVRHHTDDVVRPVTETRWYVYLVLGMVEVLTILASDAILPCLPLVRRDLDGDVGLIALYLQIPLCIRPLTTLFLQSAVRPQGMHLRRALFAISGAVYAGLGMIAASASTLPTLLLARVGQGLAEGVMGSAAFVASLVVEPTKQGAVLVSIANVRPAAVVLSPAIGGLLCHFTGWRVLLRWLAAWGCVNLISGVALFPSSCPAQKDDDTTTNLLDHPSPTKESPFRHHEFAAFTGLMACFMAQMLGLLYTAPFFLSDYYGILPLRAGLILSAIPLSGLAGALVASLLNRRVRTPKLILILVCLWGLSGVYLFLAARLHLFAYGWWYSISAVCAVSALGFALGPLTKQYLVAALACTSRTLESQNMIQTTTAAVGSILATVRYTGSPHNTLYLMCNFMAIGTAWFWVVLGKDTCALHGLRAPRPDAHPEDDGSSEGYSISYESSQLVGGKSPRTAEWAASQALMPGTASIPSGNEPGGDLNPARQRTASPLQWADMAHSWPSASPTSPNV